MSWRRGKYKKHREIEGERASGIWYLLRNKDILYCILEHTMYTVQYCNISVSMFI